MTCPHCQAGFLPEGARRCPLCGQLRSGSQTAVSVDDAPADPTPAQDYSAADELVSRQLGTLFRIERPLKHGRVSHVYSAHDASGGGPGREVALKVYILPPGTPPVDGARFQQAARTAAGLDHPNIARPYRHGTTDKLWWYAMDYVPAPSVAERLAAGRGLPLDVPLTWRIALQVASALDYAHRRGFVHGALKPTDILLDDAGWVHLVDTGFGFAARAFSRGGESAENDPARTYFAPEYFTSPRPVGPLADQYSLALIVRECLTGAPPQTGTASAVPLPPAAGPNAAQLLQRALAQTPSQRFVGVLDFVATLTGGGPQKLGVTPRRSPPRGARRPVLLFDTEDPPQRRRYRLGLSLALMLGAGVLWVAAQPGQAGDMSRANHVGSTERVTAVRPPEPAPVAAEPAPPVDPPPQPTPLPKARAAAPPRRPPPTPTPAPVVAAPGFLSVSTRPWALLSVDGRLIGNTPKVNVRLAAGMHQFRLQRPGFKTYEAAVKVKAGETVSITNLTLTATTP